MSDLVETTTREVRVFSTLIRRKLDSQATTWGELQTELKREKIRFDNMRVAIVKSKLTLSYIASTSVAVNALLHIATSSMFP